MSKVDCESCWNIFESEVTPIYCCVGSVGSQCGCLGYAINGPFICEDCLNKSKEKEKRVVEFMITNGLGDDDMKNDISLPNEV